MGTRFASSVGIANKQQLGDLRGQSPVLLSNHQATLGIPERYDSSAGARAESDDGDSIHRTPSAVAGAANRTDVTLTATEDEPTHER